MQRELLAGTRQARRVKCFSWHDIIDYHPITVSLVLAGTSFIFHRDQPRRFFMSPGVHCAQYFLLEVSSTRHAEDVPTRIIGTLSPVLRLKYQLIAARHSKPFVHVGQNLCLSSH